MKISLLAAVMAMTLSACTTSTSQYPDHAPHRKHGHVSHDHADHPDKHHHKREHKKKHKHEKPMIGMANPASVYCQKVGGKVRIHKESNGEVGYCHLPNGQVVEEWKLYRAAH